MKKLRLINRCLVAFIAVIGVTFAHQARAHDDPEANHTGGPCWIWEIGNTPIYCIFTKGDRLNHPPPRQPK